MKKIKPHIIIIIARGEAVRNFIYSKFLKFLAKDFDITLLTQINHPDAINTASPHIKNIIKLNTFQENSWIILFRDILHTAHYRMIWTEAVKYYWGRHDNRVKGDTKELFRLKLWRTLGYFFANRFMLRVGTMIDNWLTILFRPTEEFEIIFKKIRPDMVFNCSHIHGLSADLPIRIANKLKIKTGVFVFSWDNITSRGRIFPEYDYYYVWTYNIKDQLLKLYNGIIKDNQIIVTGTPQFDFHYSKDHIWPKSKLLDVVGLDKERPYILYTTGMASDFPYENLIIEELIHHIKKIEASIRPQIVVRTYIKGISKEILSLKEEYEDDPDVYFPINLWNKKWIMPLYVDTKIYTNLLRYSILGINTASTVTLELMLYNKPAINIGFEPPNSNLPTYSKYSRHISYEHYRPVAKSKGVFIARSLDDLLFGLNKLMNDPTGLINDQKSFIATMFNKVKLGRSGEMIAKSLASKIMTNNEK